MDMENDNDLIRAASNEDSSPEEEFFGGEDEIIMGEVNNEAITNTQNLVPADNKSELLNALNEEPKQHEPEENVIVLPPQILDVSTLGVRR